MKANHDRDGCTRRCRRAGQLGLVPVSREFPVWARHIPISAAQIPDDKATAARLCLCSFAELVAGTIFEDGARALFSMLAQASHLGWTKFARSAPRCLTST
jgi:hypothetical protein